MPEILDPSCFGAACRHTSLAVISDTFGREPGSVPIPSTHSRNSPIMTRNEDLYGPTYSHTLVQIGGSLRRQFL